MPLLDLFWAMLWFYLFFLWIWVVVSVLTDVFRSDDLSGGWKALWALFVVLLPLLGVFAYLVARGDNMRERAVRSADTQEQHARDYIREAAAPSPADEIAKLQELQRSGVLTEEEFRTQKAKLLG